MCEAAKVAVRTKAHAWLEAQMNIEEMWDRETDHEGIKYAHSLKKTDPAQYFKEYLTLAEGGSLWSANCLGAAFEIGVGTERDLAQAEKWYRRAFEGGSADALVRLGALYVRSQQYAKAEEVYRSGAERNWAPAMYRLASVYAKSPDWSRRRDEARTLLERAGAAGDILAKKFLTGAMVRGLVWGALYSGGISIGV
jgi:TPR repeat protein